MVILCRRVAIIAGAPCLVAIGCAVLPPLAQDPLYHAFGDGLPGVNQ
jgi:hypothetical protein